MSKVCQTTSTPQDIVVSFSGSSNAYNTSYPTILESFNSVNCERLGPVPADMAGKVWVPRWTIKVIPVNKSFDEIILEKRKFQNPNQLLNEIREILKRKS